MFGGDKYWCVTMQGRDTAAAKSFVQNIWVNEKNEDGAAKMARDTLEQAGAEFVAVIESARKKSSVKLEPGRVLAQGRIYFGQQ